MTLDLVFVPLESKYNSVATMRTKTANLNEIVSFLNTIDNEINTHEMYLDMCQRELDLLTTSLDFIQDQNRRLAVLQKIEDTKDSLVKLSTISMQLETDQIDLIEAVNRFSNIDNYDL